LHHVLQMQRLHPGQVILQHRDQRGGKGCEAVFLTLARADGQLL
jgi:hypothetical protein